MFPPGQEQQHSDSRDLEFHLRSKIWEVKATFESSFYSFHKTNQPATAIFVLYILRTEKKYLNRDIVA